MGQRHARMKLTELRYKAGQGIRSVPRALPIFFYHRFMLIVSGGSCLGFAAWSSLPD